MSITNRYILAIDQSTSGTKAILFNRKGSIEGSALMEHKQYYPQNGFVEHDPVEIFSNTLALLNRLVGGKGLDHSHIAGIAVTNQRETAMVWDRTTGIPVNNAAVWQCQRGAELCAKLKEQGFEDMIRSKTGLIIDPYFSASKISWIIKNIPEAAAKMKNGDLLFGTMDTWLLWKLTNGKVHATDFSNACRTMLFNIHNLTWDKELTELFGLKGLIFPEVRYSDTIFGYTDPSVIFESPVPIAGLMGDSHAALFGQTGWLPGMAKATYGTGSSIMMNIGNKPLSPPEGLVTSIGWGRDNKIDYVFEGNIHCTGDTIKWLVKEMQLLNNSAESEVIAVSVPDNNGVYLVPAFVGLGAPYWDNWARACISGMGRNTNKAHVVRAALESIAYQIRDLIDLMTLKGGISLVELRVDGGPTRNNFLMQFQADMVRKNIVRTSIPEISALGSAFMAGLATGFWSNTDEIQTLRFTDRIFQPEKDIIETDALYEGWKLAVKRARIY